MILHLLLRSQQVVSSLASVPELVGDFVVVLVAPRDTDRRTQRRRGVLRGEMVDTSHDRDMTSDALDLGSAVELLAHLETW